MMLGFFGFVTSTAVTFFGADSCAIHSTRRLSRVFCSAMPSPQFPKPSSGWWASSFMFLAMFMARAPLVARMVTNSRAKHQRPRGVDFGGSAALAAPLLRESGRTAVLAVTFSATSRMPGRDLVVPHRHRQDRRRDLRDGNECPRASVRAREEPGTFVEAPVAPLVEEDVVAGVGRIVHGRL